MEGSDDRVALTTTRFQTGAIENSDVTAVVW
jgi:hypothetical protein